MFESIYIGLSGMSTFSRNLTVIGNNVSNLNTTAFKSSQLSFSDLLYSHQFSDANNGTGADLQFGSGVGSGSTRVLFTQGTLRQTGNATDLAIDGNGFFVLRDPNNNSIYAANGRNTYTRDGEFDFDSNGFLISKLTGGRVQAFNGGLEDINISSLRTTPPQATSNVSFVNNLDSGGTTADATVSVFDSGGAPHTLKVHFTKVSGSTPPEWQYQVQDETNAVIASGDLQFNANGSPASGTTQTFTFTPIGGAAPTPITFDFGAAGGFSGVTSFSGATGITVGSSDGFAVGALTEATFNQDGVLTITYSNGQTRTGPTLALASFGAPDDLDVIAGGIYDNRSGQAVTVGAPRTGVMGAIAAKSLESANVDLTQQFSDLIVTQRGYQASSQVISTANDMIQQLLDITAKR
jgi:flagellar hook protein FlgE